MRLLFWTFFPDEGLVLLIMLAGLALMVGLRTAATSLFGAAVLFAFLGPLVESLVSGLDPFWQVVILGVLAFVILRALLNFVFGSQTTSHLAALLLHDIILLPFRLVGRVLGGRHHP